jgi:hypothetical protein
MADRLDTPCDGLRPPDPPSELRRQTLRAASAALENGRRPDLWTRLWTSRVARAAWAATVAGLVLCNLATRFPRPDAAASPGLPAAAAAVGELAPVIELGRLTAELPGWEIAAARRDAAPERTSS